MRAETCAHYFADILRRGGLALCLRALQVGLDMPIGLLLVRRCPSLSTCGSFSL